VLFMPDWPDLLGRAAPLGDGNVRAHTFVKKWPSASQPVLLICDDGGTDRELVVKGQQGGRQPVNDQLVGRLGIEAGAPVGRPRLVDVPAELIAGEPEMQHMNPGVAHGSTWITDCSERAAYEYATAVENKPRFARLALLYGWIQASDHQFIYENAEPHLVHSVDHGHFFPGGPDWTPATLQGAPTPTADAAIIGECGLTQADLDACLPAFGTIADEVIATIVGGIPDTWGLSVTERVAVAEYLGTRRDVLFPPQQEDD
jgi:hypothetical protein